MDLVCLTVGDIVKVGEQLYLWYGNNYIADTCGVLSCMPPPDCELVEPTYQERLDYFNKLYDNGLCWNDVTKSFEAKDETTAKYVSNNIFFSKKFVHIKN